MAYRPLVPELVTLHVWGVPTTRVPSALLAMARDRRPVARAPGHTFHKLLGTGDGSTFTGRDADLGHWALLVCWADARAAAGFERSPVVRRWDARAAAPAGERLRVALRPLASRGSWGGKHPFGDPASGAAAPAYTGPVAAITRARLRARLAPTFWRAVPPVSHRLNASTGLVASLGIGEAPVGLQGTFSLWESATALNDFAYGSAEHQRAISDTHRVGWYAEELFARFAVVEARGTLRGRGIDIAT